MTRAGLLLLALAAALPAAEPVPLFDGRTLAGWEGDPRCWRVEDGCITGETTAEQPLKRNTFLIWRGGTVADCTIELAYRILSAEGNSGLQLRSTDAGGFLVTGYQANIEQGGRNRNGMLYDEGGGREVLALAGERTRLGDGTTRLRSERFAETAQLFAAVHGRGEWNRYRVTARGAQLQVWINDVAMCEVVDEATTRATSGIVALQLHAGKPMRIQFKDLVLTRLEP